MPIDGNMEIVITKLIEELKSQIDGKVIDRASVIDHLLDLRLEAGEHAYLTTTIDEVLGTVPGRNMVESDWWSSTLDSLIASAERLPA